MTKVFPNITLIGVGLIGSSLAQAIQKNALCDALTLVETNPDHLAQCRTLGLEQHGGKVFYTSSAPEGSKTADLVIFCVPIRSIKNLCEEIAPALKKGALVSDVGSAKGTISAQMSDLLPLYVEIVPAHPIAGTENSGPLAGFASLFENRWAILTPTARSSKQATEKLSSFWEALGSSVELMSPEIHDQILAITSHVPHLLAYTIVHTATELSDEIQQEIVKYSAGGFRDFTRIAASDPIMWRDIFIENKQAVLDILQRLSEDISMMQQAIRKEDADKIETIFNETRHIRRNIIDAGQAGQFDPREAKDQK